MKELTHFPTWNAFLFGEESCLVKLNYEYAKSERLFQGWIAVYDSDKKLNAIGGRSWNLANNRLSFLNAALGKFVFVEFEVDKVDLSEENATIQTIQCHYFNTIAEVYNFLIQKRINLSELTYSWKVDYPLGG